MSYPSVNLPRRAPLLSRAGWAAFFTALIAVCALAPALNLWVPEGSPFHLSGYMVTLLGKIMCYAICALAIDLIWGYTGILSLGHGLFFALGGYMMGMYLMRQIGRDGNYKSDLPDFMVFLDWKTLPWHWTFSDSFIATLILIIAVPGLVAFVFGYFAFRSRIKGVYFSIITQAMTFAAMLLFFRNETGFGGNNGFTDFKFVLGLDINEPSTRRLLYGASILLLAGVFLLFRWLTCTKAGQIMQAIRDGENRVRFSGYNTAHYKLFVFVLAAMISGLGGALYVAQIGIINPSEMTPDKSLEAVVWVAVGGRGTLLGPILGAVSVNALKSWATRAAPELWLFLMGALFIVVVLLLPGGLVSIPARLKKWWTRRQAPPPEADAKPASPTAKP